MAAASGWTLTKRTWRGPRDIPVARRIPGARRPSAAILALVLDWKECADPVGVVRLGRPAFDGTGPRARMATPFQPFWSCHVKRDMEKAGGQTSGSATRRVSSNPTTAAFAITPDATYDAIAALLDEKASTRDSFVEEYRNDIKDAPNLSSQHRCAGNDAWTFFLAACVANLIGVNSPTRHRADKGTRQQWRPKTS